MASSRTITIESDSRQQEYTVNATGLLPGMLVEVISTGKVQAHAGAGLSAQPRFALEDELQGRQIDEQFTAAEKVQTKVFKKGERFMGRLANGQNAAIGSKLESNGDGYLRVVATDTSAATIEVNSIVGEAVEAIDMSGSSAVDPDGFIICEAW